MSITVDLNAVWIILGMTIVLIGYILSLIKLPERHWAFQVIWALLWGVFILVSIISLVITITEPSIVEQGLLGVLILLGVAHITACLCLVEM